MAKSGIFAIRRAKKSDMEALSKATGGRVVTTLEDLSKDDLGNASKVDERKNWRLRHGIHNRMQTSQSSLSSTKRGH